MAIGLRQLCLFRPNTPTIHLITMPPYILPLTLRYRELGSARAGRTKVAVGIAASLALLAASFLPAANASATEYKEPDYSKFKVENGPITLEFWSWVGGLDNTVKDF